VMVLAAVIAAAVMLIFEPRRIDRWALALVGLFIGLYVINVGSSHGIAWVQGVRLTAEPLLLLLAGLVLPRPARTFRWAMGTLILIACLVAAYGIVQQIVGKWELVEWGYSFDSQVRSLDNGWLRSFGTLDDPFAYGVLLLFGLVAVVFWLRSGPLAWSAALLLLVGLWFSYNRTAVLMLAAIAGLVIWRRGHGTSGLLIVVAIVIAGTFTLINAGGTESSTSKVYTDGLTGPAGSANVILNGRISAWRAALGEEPADWLLGRGVGEVGTAAARSRYTLAPAEDPGGGAQAQAVDSGYLATIADVGFVGLGVLVALLVYLARASIAAIGRGLDEGWVAMALLLILLIDALSRASFTGFPTAFLGMLLIGVALGASERVRPASMAAEFGR
jgi:hypothetical protein